MCELGTGFTSLALLNVPAGILYVSLAYLVSKEMEELEKGRDGEIQSPRKSITQDWTFGRQEIQQKA